MSFNQILKNFPWKFLCITILVIAISLGFLFIFSAHVPFSMDEFIQYHALSCLYYPSNNLNTFRESCSVHSLAVFSDCYWPLRSFDYVGSLPGLIYFPLFYLWPSLYSARFLGLLFLMLQAFCLNRIFKVHFLVAFIGLLTFMPYAFQHVVDTGVENVWYCKKEDYGI